MKPFNGFTIPDIGILPPEFYDIMPQIKTIAEMKVTLAALRHALQFGDADVPYSLDDFAAACGFDKKTVLRGIRAGLARKTLMRIPFGKSFVYRLNFKECQNDTPCMHDIHTHSKHASTSTSVLRNKGNGNLAEDICKLGVATRVALDLVKKHDAAKLRQHIAYAEHAQKTKMARNTAAWFVASVRDNWGPPLGFKDPKRTVEYTLKQMREKRLIQ